MPLRLVVGGWWSWVVGLRGRVWIVKVIEGGISLLHHWLLILVVRIVESSWGSIDRGGDTGLLSSGFLCKNKGGRVEIQRYWLGGGSRGLRGDWSRLIGLRVRLIRILLHSLHLVLVLSSEVLIRGSLRDEGD